MYSANWAPGTSGDFCNFGTNIWGCDVVVTGDQIYLLIFECWHICSFLSNSWILWAWSYRNISKCPQNDRIWIAHQMTWDDESIKRVNVVMRVLKGSMCLSKQRDLYWRGRSIYTHSKLTSFSFAKSRLKRTFENLTMGNRLCQFVSYFWALQVIIGCEYLYDLFETRSLLEIEN